MTAYSTNPASAAPLAQGSTILQRISAAIHASRVREETARTYSKLLCADDHTLADLGVTRLEVLQLLEDLNRR